MGKIKDLKLALIKNIILNKKIDTENIIFNIHIPTLQVSEYLKVISNVLKHVLIAVQENKRKQKKTKENKRKQKKTKENKTKEKKRKEKKTKQNKTKQNKTKQNK